jgi:hypothetical protein
MLAWGTTIHIYATFCRRQYARNNIKQTALPGAIRANNCYTLSGLQLK